MSSDRRVLSSRANGAPLRWPCHSGGQAARRSKRPAPRFAFPSRGFDRGRGRGISGAMEPARRPPAAPPTAWNSAWLRRCAPRIGACAAPGPSKPACSRTALMPRPGTIPSAASPPRSNKRLRPPALPSCIAMRPVCTPCTSAPFATSFCCELWKCQTNPVPFPDSRMQSPRSSRMIRRPQPPIHLRPLVNARRGKTLTLQGLPPPGMIPTPRRPIPASAHPSPRSLPGLSR